MKKTLGGDRLGSGNKLKVELRNYERSTHDLSSTWKSTLGVGTLVPFMSMVGLTGDSFEIKLDTVIHTIPTNGPLFGSFKVQLDVFVCPMRLYIRELHNNKLKIGLNMSDVFIPQIRLEGDNPRYVGDSPPDVDNWQINPSSIFKYLGISGVGIAEGDYIVGRNFNALPFLSYWDIYKNYYANLQEEIGAVIHTPSLEESDPVDTVTSSPNSYTFVKTSTYQYVKYLASSIVNNVDQLLVDFSGDIGNTVDLSRFKLTFYYGGNPSERSAFLNDTTLIVDVDLDSMVITVPTWWNDQQVEEIELLYLPPPNNQNLAELPRVQTFDLADIDNMREYLLSNSAAVIDKSIDYQPYSLALANAGSSGNFRAASQFKQEGLGLKTYQSDLFNNWLSTEWLDGSNGINEITKIQTNGDGFYLDDLNIMTKVYTMLNRVAVSNGSYKSWLETMYDEKIDNWQVESPVYVGGLIKELAFDEVVSTAQTDISNTEQPLGTLAGKGVMLDRKKGGYIDIKIKEPSYIIGIVSLTPRVDYSQGNSWDVNLKSIDDLHKPGLDGIGFQELITDQMAWFDTLIDKFDTVTFKSAGKQPAWLNYMTDVNRSYGNFAIANQEMFMTLNRRYEALFLDDTTEGIKDVTTYIDPSKYNDVFSYNKIDAMNFWVQISKNIKARRKMSARIMPNL